MNSKLKQRSDSPRSASIPSVLFYGLFHPTTIFVHHIYSPKIYIHFTFHPRNMSYPLIYLCYYISRGVVLCPNFKSENRNTLTNDSIHVPSGFRQFNFRLLLEPAMPTGEGEEPKDQLTATAGTSSRVRVKSE